MRGNVDVFLEKDGKRENVQVELRVEGGRKRIWFVEKTPEQPQRRPDEKGDETVTEEASEDSVTVEDPVAEEQATGMSEVDPEEMKSQQKMWLVEKVISLEKEKDEMIKTIQEMRAKIELQDKMMAEMAQLHGAIETSIAQIVEQVQRQDTFNEGVRASFTSLAEEIGKHQDNFREVARIFQAHEEHMAKTGAASQEMAQYINALIKENENKTVWISSLMRESQEQTQVLRQHHLGLQVHAEVIKAIVAGRQQQQPQQCQTIATTGPTVTVIDGDDDEDRLDFWEVRVPTKALRTMDHGN